MKSYSLRAAFSRRMHSLADWLTIVRANDAQTARYVFHPMGVIRVVTPEETAVQSKNSAR